MSEAQHRLALPQGTRIEDFEFHCVLGYGGFGIAYLGWDLALDIPVAIKEYLPPIAVRTSDNSVVPKASEFQGDFTRGLDRFLVEARTLALFDHRHLVKVRHFLQAHNTAYIVMEYAEGETLSDYLNHKGVLTELELKEILHPILKGLEAVHREGFLHRDIKPDNIVIRAKDRSPVLIDFGAARQAVGAKIGSLTAIVTPGYAPIEQYSTRGNQQGPWTDIYALGYVCYHALTGDVPIPATDRTHSDPLIPVSDRCKGRASHQFLAAIDHALQVAGGARPQSVSEWRAELGDTPVVARSNYVEKQHQAEIARKIEDLITTGLSSPVSIALDVGRGMMYWTDSLTRKIQRANLDGSNVKDLITTGLSHPVSIALDVGHGKMYWTDFLRDKIQRANLDGSNVEDLVTTGLSSPVGIALDVERGKMYWTDFSRRKIRLANLDGSQVEDLITITTGLSSPVGIALDVERRKMYWTDRDTAKIQRANLDGLNVEDLITTGLVTPRGIALDVGRRKMYWTDRDTAKIQRANFDGSQVEDLITTGLRTPFGIALDVGRGIMYWTDYGTKKIQRANISR